MADNKPMWTPMKPHWFVAMALIQTIVYVAKKHHARIIANAKMLPPESVFNIYTEREGFIKRIERAIHDQLLVMGRPMHEVVKFTFDDSIWAPANDNRFMTMRFHIAPDPTAHFFIFEIDFRKEMRHCVTMLGPGLRTNVDVFEVNYQEEADG